MNSRNVIESALMECSLFLHCMFSPVEYNAAKSLGEAAKRYSRFLSCMFSPVVYSAARRSGETAEYMDGTLANFFVAFSGLLCNKIVKRASKKLQNGGLGGLGEALGGLRGPSRVRYGKRTLKSSSLTPSATFFGTPFWTLFEPWAHFFHECSRFRLKNSSDFGCAEFCIDLLPFSDVNPEAKTF